MKTGSYMSATSPKTSIDNATTEPPSDHDSVNVFTLPYATESTVSNRSVMWHEPDPKGEGARSAVPKTGLHERGVTDGVPTPAGAALAREPHATLATTGGQHARLGAGTVTRADGDDLTTQSMMDWVGWRSRVGQMALMVAAEIAAGEGSIDAMTDDRALGIVRLGRQLVQLKMAIRKRRKDTKPSKATVECYRKKSQQIQSEITTLGADEPEPLIQVMGNHAARKNTFSAVKSALMFSAFSDVRELLRSQNAAQAITGHSANWRSQVLNLLKALQTFIEVDDLNRTDCLEFVGGTAKAKRSKRHDLPHLPDGWQDRFIKHNESSPTYRDAGVLLLHCGLRPVELRKGVKVTATAEGITVRILGGKVRSIAGQPWRQFTLDASKLPLFFVNKVKQSQEIKVSAEPEALRAHLSRLSDSVFLQGEYRPNGATKKEQRYTLSAYTFRHSFVTELRDDGWETVDIAAVIGESSAETVSYYGTRSRGRGKRKRQTSVLKATLSAARAVRPLDMKGLKKIEHAKLSARKSGAPGKPRA